MNHLPDNAARVSLHVSAGKLRMRGRSHDCEQAAAKKDSVAKHNLLSEELLKRYVDVRSSQPIFV